MNKKLIILAITLFLLCGIRIAYIIHETKSWEPYVKRENDYDSLVYAYRTKDYNHLYQMVIVNETLDDTLSDELYDFAHYYNELCLAHKNYMANKDYSSNVIKMNEYLDKISTKEILESIEELNNIYTLKQEQ